MHGRKYKFNPKPRGVLLRLRSWHCGSHKACGSYQGFYFSHWPLFWFNRPWNINHTKDRTIWMIKLKHYSDARLPKNGTNQRLNIHMTTTHRKHSFSFHIIIISKAACRLVSFLPPHAISVTQAAGKRLVLPAVATNFISASHIISHLANK